MQKPADLQCSIKDCPISEEVAQLRERCRKLEELSYVDALTGLYNFRYLQRALETELERTRRTRFPTSLIMVDLDHFKNINTEYGHEAGNIALTWVGKIIRDSIRIMDIPCRYGGEEFALVVPGISLQLAVKIAERIRETLLENPVMLHNQTVQLTASFGVAVCDFSEDITVSEFLNKADRYLFQAKTTGRNRVCAEPAAVAVPVDEVTGEEKRALLAAINENEEKEP